MFSSVFIREDLKREIIVKDDGHSLLRPSFSIQETIDLGLVANSQRMDISSLTWFRKSFLLECHTTGLSTTHSTIEWEKGGILLLR